MTTSSLYALLGKANRADNVRLDKNCDLAGNIRRIAGVYTIRAKFKTPHGMQG